MWFSRLREDLLKREKGELERELEEDLAQGLGIPKNKIRVAYAVCGDGTVIPSITFEYPLSKTQQQWASQILDFQSGIKQNTRGNTTLN